MKKILFVLPILAMFVLGGCGYQMSEGDGHGHEGDDHVHYEGNGHDHDADEDEGHEMYESGLLNIEIPKGYEYETADAGGASVFGMHDGSEDQFIGVMAVYGQNSEGGNVNLIYQSWVDEEGYSFGDDVMNIGGYEFKDVVFEPGSDKGSEDDEGLAYISFVNDKEVSLLIFLTIDSPITEQMQEILDSVEFFPAE